MRKSRVRQFRKFLKLLPIPRYRRALIHKVGAAIEHTITVRSFGDLRTVLDIGANVGQFSLVARNEYPNGRVIAFEPLAAPAAIYRKIFDGDDMVTLHQVAIGLIRSEVEMHVSARNDSSSLLPISSYQTELFPGTGEVGREKVMVEPLTNFVSKDQLTAPVLLKIDVQGSELDVLSSSQPLLPHIDWIYVEASFVPFYESQALAHDVVAFLLKNGFRLNGIYNPVYDKAGAVVQADFLFARAA